MKLRIFLHNLCLCAMLSTSMLFPAHLLAEEETEQTPEESETEEQTSEDEESEATDSKITLTIKDWKELDRPKAQTEKNKSSLLLKEVDERDVITLNAGDEEFIGLFSEQNTAQPLGGVLIIHDSGLGPNNQYFTAPLRKRLPDYGWNTLAISLPEPETTPLPSRKWPPYPADFTLNSPAEDENSTEEETDPDTESESSDEESLETESNEETSASDTQEEPETAQAKNEPSNTVSAQERTMTRIEASVQELISRGQLNIILVGHGVGASWAISYLESSSNPEMFTLVVIDPKLPPVEQDKNYINTRLEKFIDVPILDIVSTQNSFTKKQAKERRNTANRKQLKAYQQLFTRATSNSEVNHNRIVKRIRGWLAQNAPGEEQPTQ